MPLDRAHVTVASRIMLPTYVIMFTLIGLNYLTLNADTVSASPALRYADRAVSLPLWGAMFIGGAAVMLGALMLRKREAFRFGLWICALCMALWTVVLAAASLTADVSPTACAWPAFVVTACVASDASLRAREV